MQRLLVAMLAIGCGKSDSGIDHVSSAPEPMPVAAAPADAGFYYRTPDRPPAPPADAYVPSKREIDDEARAAALEAKQAKAAQRGRTKRQSFVDGFDELNREAELPIGMALGVPDTTIMISMTHGHCSKPLLEKLVEISGGPMRRVGFVTLACADDPSTTVDL